MLDTMTLAVIAVIEDSMINFGGQCTPLHVRQYASNFSGQGLLQVSTYTGDRATRTCSSDEYVEVNDSIGHICNALGLSPELEYTGGTRGWIGDNPFIFLDTKKIQATGWKPKLTIEQGIIRTLRWLEANRWVYHARR